LTQFNVIGVMQTDEISDDFCQIGGYVFIGRIIESDWPDSRHFAFIFVANRWVISFNAKTRGGA